MVDLPAGASVRVRLPGIIARIEETTGPEGPPGAGNINTVNGDDGPDVLLTQDDIPDGSTYVQFSAAEKTKLADLNEAELLDRAHHTGAQTASTISDFATAVATATATKADLVGGVVPTSQIPALAINETFSVASQAAMLALTAQRGDMAIRGDNGRTYVLSTDDPTTLANWKEVMAAGQVQSVAGKTGVISLVKADVGLASVDNTSDAAKPVSTAQQAALDAKKTDSMSTNKVLGRATAGTGAIEELGIGSGLAVVGGNLTATSGSGTGDVVGPASSITDGIPLFADTSGKVLKGSGVTLASKAQAIPFSVTLLNAGSTAITPVSASASTNTEVLAAVKPTRQVVDLASATQVRLTCLVITAPAAGTLKLSYMTTNAATWSGTDVGVSVNLAGTNGVLRDSGWVNLPAGAKVNDCYIAALVGTSPPTAPTVGSLTAYFR